MRSARSLAALLLISLMPACIPILDIDFLGSGPTRGSGTLPPSANTDKTDIHWTPESPVVEGRNAVWSGTTALSWQAMAKAANVQGDMDVGAPAPPELVAALNRTKISESEIGPTDEFVHVGWGKQGYEKVAQQVRRAGISLIAPPPSGAVESLATVCTLQANLPFRHPFRVHSDLMRFNWGPENVVTFGLAKDDESDRAERMASQIRWHELPQGDGPILPPMSLFALTLQPKDQREQIVLARMPRPKTLKEAWEVVRKLLAQEGEEPPVGAELKIPKIDFRIEGQLAALAGAPVRNARLASGLPAQIGTLEQHLRFTLTEKGASLVSVGVTWMFSMGMPMSTKFDGPFLVALTWRGAANPYFLLWIENDDLLVKG